MVSETTLISMPLKGSAALMNHSISFICSSFDRVEGWNSLSTHFFAASMSAKALADPSSRATAVAVPVRYRLSIARSSLFSRCTPN